MCIRALVLAGVLMVGGGMQMRAQMSGPPPSPPIGTKEDPARAVDGLLSMMEFQVMGAAKAMPADKYSFAPAQGIFAPGQTTQFDTVRTFVAQVTHLAQANYFFAGVLSGLKPDVDVKAIADLKDKDQIVAAAQGSFDFARKAMATLTTQNAFESVQFNPLGNATRAGMAGFLVAHGFDHYGQMALYLRMNGVVPPASAKE